jgi:hypothetical protein
MMMIVRVLVCWLFAWPALAQMATTEKTKELWKAFASDATSAIWRPAFAKATFEYCTEMNTKVARNTPREDDWLDTEMNSNDMERTIRAMDTNEYARRNFVLFAQQCREVMYALTVPGRSRSEAALWVDFIRMLNDGEGMRDRAKKIALIGQSNADDYFLIGLWGAIRLKVIDSAILPLLKAP